jgi:hypothetical protein
VTLNERSWPSSLPWNRVSTGRRWNERLMELDHSATSFRSHWKGLARNLDLRDHRADEIHRLGPGLRIRRQLLELRHAAAIKFREVRVDDDCGGRPGPGPRASIWSLPTTSVASCTCTALARKTKRPRPLRTLTMWLASSNRWSGSCASIQGYPEESH